MKILGGAQLPTRESLHRRAAVVLDGVARPARGIALIHQELMLAPNLDIASNIFLGNERARNCCYRAGASSNGAEALLAAPAQADRKAGGRLTAA